MLNTPYQSEHLGDGDGFILLGPLLPGREMQLIIGDCRPGPEENLNLTPGEKLTMVNKVLAGKGDIHVPGMGTTAADASGVWVYMCTGREGSDEKSFLMQSIGDTEKKVIMVRCL